MSQRLRTWKEPKSFLEEAAIENGDYGKIPIFGRFTRAVGSYRVGYKKPQG